MYQLIIIAGNLGRDPELRHTNDGTSVTTLNVATSDNWTDKDGEKQERTTWWRVSVWGKTADACAKYLSKGRQVLVQCTTQPDPETGNPRMYDKNDGTKGCSYEVRASVVKFLGGRSGNGADEEFAADGPPPAEEIEEDSIPF